jgi:hypothetical protein
MIDIKCRCGETYHADKSHAGRSIRCPKCGTVNRIEHSSPVQSTHQSKTGTVPVPTAGWRPAKQGSRSTASHSRRTKASIVAGVLIGVLGIAVALERLWSDSSKKLDAASSPTLKQSASPSSSNEIQRHPVEVTPPIPGPWRQTGNLSPAPSHTVEFATPPTTNGPAQQYLSPICARDQQIERPRTGTRITPDLETSGVSKLMIKNGTQRDAAVRLVDEESGRAVRFVYIEAGDDYTLGNIVVGTYVLRFASGYDWVVACTDFIREPDYSEFESALTFEVVTPRNGQDGYITRYEVTLNQVPLGNAKKRTINREHFFEGVQGVTLTP